MQPIFFFSAETKKNSTAMAISLPLFSSPKRRVEKQHILAPKIENFVVLQHQTQFLIEMSQTSILFFFSQMKKEEKKLQSASFLKEQRTIE